MFAWQVFDFSDIHALTYTYYKSSLSTPLIQKDRMIEWMTEWNEKSRKGKQSKLTLIIENNKPL